MTDSGQKWARIIKNRAEDREVMEVILAINTLTKSGCVNRAGVMVACAQILAQSITGEPSVAHEIRSGVMSLIDGFAMQSAVTASEAP